MSEQVKQKCYRINYTNKSQLDRRMNANGD